MKKIAFIDHSFHRQTKSSTFFLDILRSRYEVELLWDEAWQGGAFVSADAIKATGADLAFFWQSIAPASELARIDVPMVFAPMYDDAAHKADAYWMRLLGLDLRVVSFCQALTKRTEAVGLPTRTVQYYPEPSAQAPIEGGAYRAFMWDRGHLSFDRIAPLLLPNECVGVALKLDADPGSAVTLPSPKLEAAFQIETFEGFLPFDRYEEIVKGADLYVAPRPLEGIGMSFLEALGRGQAVLGVNSPTLNEYVTDGVDGFLFGLAGRATVTAAEIARVRVASRERFAKGRERWEAAVGPLLDWLEAPIAPTRRPSGPRLAAATAGEIVEKAMRRARRLLRAR